MAFLLRQKDANNGWLTGLEVLPERTMHSDVIQKIAQLLTQSAAAHHDYEVKLLHAEDKDWHSWYAEYLIRHGLLSLLNREMTSDQLAEFFKLADVEYKRVQSGQAWPEYYASKLIQTIE